MYQQPCFERGSYRLQMCWLRNAFATLWIVLLISPLVYGDSELDRSRFLEEYQTHASLLQQRYSNVFVDLVMTYDAGTTQQIQHVTGKFNRSNYLLKGKSKHVQKDTGKVLSESKESIECRNAQYSFTLRPGEGGQYALRDLKIHDANHETELCFLTIPYADNSSKRTYLDIAHDPRTRIVSLEDCVWQGRTRKALECRYSIISPETHKPIEVTRTYYFSPTDGWICCGFRTTGVSPKKKEYIEEVYLYEPEKGDNLPKLKRTEKWLRNSQDPHQDKLIDSTDISEFRRSQKPFSDSEFTLSAFGLPEPMGVKQPEPPRSWLWLIAAAVAAVALAMLFAWLKRRRSSIKTAKT